MVNRLKNLEDRLQKIYKSAIVNEEKCFITNKNEIIHLTGLQSFRAIVIEYAASMDEARKNMFEDGDLFYMDELTEDEMLDEMIKEIEGNE